MTEENLAEVVGEPAVQAPETASAEGEQPATQEEPKADEAEAEAEQVKAEVTLEGLAHAFVFLLGVVEGLPISIEQAERLNFYKQAFAI